MRRLALIATAIALLGGSVFAYASHRSESVGPFSSSPVFGKKVGVFAHVGGLYPGARKFLRVEIANPRQHRVTVRRIRVSADRANPGCAASVLTFTPPTRLFGITPLSVRTVKVPVRMRLSAPDACQGGKFKLRIHSRLRGPR
jgi:hypothetical protein